MEKTTELKIGQIRSNNRGVVIRIDDIIELKDVTDVLLTRLNPNENEQYTTTLSETYIKKHYNKIINWYNSPLYKVINNV